MFVGVATDERWLASFMGVDNPIWAITKDRIDHNYSFGDLYDVPTEKWQRKRVFDDELDIHKRDMP